MNDWSAILKDILSELQRGKHIAMLSVYLSSLVFSEHVRMYFENAKHLCVGSASDFNVWGVLYGIRHGLELWLKCLIRNRIIDRFLESVFFFPSCSFDE